MTRFNYYRVQGKQISTCLIHHVRCSSKLCVNLPRTIQAGRNYLVHISRENHSYLKICTLKNSAPLPWKIKMEPIFLSPGLLQMTIRYVLHPTNFLMLIEKHSLLPAPQNHFISPCFCIKYRVAPRYSNSTSHVFVAFNTIVKSSLFTAQQPLQAPGSWILLPWQTDPMVCWTGSLLLLPCSGWKG